MWYYICVCNFWILLCTIVTYYFLGLIEPFAFLYSRTLWRTVVVHITEAVLNSENDSICQNLCAVIPVSCNGHCNQLVTDLHFDVFSSSSLLRYAGYVPFICPISYDWYGSYEDADVWDRLLALVVRIMTATRGNLQAMCFQGPLYWVIWFEWTVRRIKCTFIDLKLRHPHCVCNIKVHCKVVKNTTSLLSVIILLIEWHVSAYSESIINFSRC
jgi:hypothetical protein